MQAGWRIGSFLGIPLVLDSSWLIILVLATYANAQDYQAWGVWLSWGAGFTAALLLFISVLLHEWGHCLAAQTQGIKINSITLFLFGGIAALEREPKTPLLTFQVAAAGPLVSLALFFIIGLTAQTLPQLSLTHKLAEQVALINGILALFNLIPGLPLDGGHMWKAIVWKLTKSRITGTRWAAKNGQVLGSAGILFGLGSATVALFSRHSITNGLWIALIAWFILQNALIYRRIADLQDALHKVKAGDAMAREFRVINADLTLRQFAEQYLLEASHVPVYVASANGRDQGLVSVDDIRFTERSQWEKQTLNNVLKPLHQIVAVLEKDSLAEAIGCMEYHRLPRLIVLLPTGGVAGTLDRGDVVRAVAKYLKVAISDSEIKRIKEECRYPSGLPLSAIAKSALET